MADAELILFAPRAARLSPEDEGWADAIGKAITGKGLTQQQVMAFLRHVEAWRVENPDCGPSDAPWAVLWTRFLIAHPAARESRGGKG